MAQTPGIECGCDKTGNYLPPAGKGILMKQGQTVREGSSKNGKYHLVAEGGDLVTISVYYGDQATPILQKIFSGAAGWGFSPDEDHFVIHGSDRNGRHWCRLYNLNPDPAQEGEHAVGWEVIPPTAVSSARICFSPHGRYLLYAAVGSNTGNLLLKVFSTKNGNEVYDGSTQSPITGAPDEEKAGGWGFSSDVRDRTFVHAFLTDPDRYILIVKNLERPDNKYVLITTPMTGGATFRFSPCGDYFLWIFNDLNGNPVCNFYRTCEENTVPDEYATGVGFVRAFTKEDGHYIEYISETQKIFDNTADQVCDDDVPPSWDHDSLVVDSITGTKAFLVWGGATDNTAVTAYRIFCNGTAVLETDTVRHAVISGLTPETACRFRVEAGDAAGNWSSDGPEATDTTTADTPPLWHNGQLTATQVQGVRLTLQWSGATDDYGIIGYKLYIDGDDSLMIPGDTTTWTMNGLTEQTTYHFRLEAGDEAGQWSGDGPALTQTTARDNPPYWPSGAAIQTLPDELTETTLGISWPEAQDDFGIVKYIIFRDNVSVATLDDGEHEYVDRDLEEGTAYSYMIQAEDEAGQRSPGIYLDVKTRSAFVEMPLVVAPGVQKVPDIDDRTVVWEDDRTGNGDIWYYDLKQDTARRWYINDAWQGTPAVGGKYKVWADTRNGDSDIWAGYYSLFEGGMVPMVICDASGDQTDPQTDGWRVVWADNRSGNWDIYMYDLTTKEEKAVCTAEGDQIHPSVDKQYIVWEDYRNGNADIYGYSLRENKEFEICVHSGEQQYPVVNALSLNDVRFFWQDNRYGNWDIYTGLCWFNLIDDIYTYKVRLGNYGNQTRPDFDDRILVYQDDRDGSEDIYECKLTNSNSGEITPVCEAPGDQVRPRISKGRIVWEDRRNDEGDIYIWDRPPGEDLMLEMRESADPVRVGDTLVYTLMARNDGPDDEPLVKVECRLPLQALLVDTVAGRGDVNRSGLTLTWDVGPLAADSAATLKLFFRTYERTLLHFSAAVSGLGYDPDPSNNTLDENTTVRYIVSDPVGEGVMPAMFVEPSGKVHMVYFNDEKVIYAVKEPGYSWVYEQVADVWETNVMAAGVVAEDNGRVDILYAHHNFHLYPDTRLYSLTKDKNEKHWNKQIVTLSDTGIYNISVVRNSRNDLHMAFVEGTTTMGRDAKIKYMNYKSGRWSHPVSIGYGSWSDLQMTIDAEDYLHMGTYWPPKYFKSKDTVVTEWGMPEWLQSQLYYGGDIEGLEIDLDADADGNPYIIYVGNDISHRQDIRLAWKTDNKWQTELIEEGGYTSRGTAIAVEPTGKIHVAYSKLYDHGRLIYATRIQNRWVKMSLDESVYSPLSLEKDANGRVHLLYMKEDHIKYVMIPPVAWLDIAPDTLIFENTGVGADTAAYLYLLNNTREVITVDSVVPADEAFEADSRILTLYKGQMKSVAVRFHPQEKKIYRSHLTVYFDGTEGMYEEIPVIGRVPGPVLVPEADTVDFGVLPLNTQDTCTVTLRNEGQEELVISDLKVEYRSSWGSIIKTDFGLLNHDCNVVPPGGSCQVTISFSPKKKGYQRSYLIIDSDDLEYPERKILLLGRSPYAVCVSGRQALDFGYVEKGQDSVLYLDIMNPGEEELHIQDYLIEGSGSACFTLEDSCTSLAPGDTCRLRIVFAPAEYKNYQAELRITSDALYRNTLVITLTGNARYRRLLVTPDSISLGMAEVGRDTSVVVTLTNGDTADVTVFEATITGYDLYEFVHPGIYGTLSAGDTLRDTITFRPVYAGDKSAVLRIVSDDSYNRIMEIPLSGIAQEPVAPAEKWDVLGSILLPEGDTVTEGRIYLYRSLEEQVGGELYHKPLRGAPVFDLLAIPEGEVTLYFDPDTSVYAGYLRTYLGNTVWWEDARFFRLDHDTSGVTIVLVPEPPDMNGTCEVAGKLVIEQGKTGQTLSYERYDGNGMPLADIPVFLSAPDAGLVAYDITDANGEFMFRHIPPGHYGFLADTFGIFMSERNDSLIITQENRQYYITAVMRQDTVHIGISDVTTGLEIPGRSGMIRVFPNPARDNLYIRFVRNITEDLVVRITGMDGTLWKVLRPGPVQEGEVLRIPVGDLPAGIYILKLTAGERAVVRKMVIR